MRRQAHSVWFLLVAIGCGSPSNDDAEGGGEPSGGAGVVGGSGGSGTGGLGSGGVPSGGLGGALPTGGTGGVVTTGGVAGTGGALPTGGTGGALPTGGTGGVVTTGGADAGGVATTGGAGTGGLVTTGGAGTGGVVTTGGDSTGGDVTLGGAGGSGGVTPPTGGAGEGGASPQIGGAGGAGTGGLQGTGGGGVGAIACGTVATPGEVITFNDDGGWCWYQDERVIVDAEANKLIIGSVAINGGRNGNIEASIYDLAGGGTPQRSTLGDLNPDDHNTAALSKIGPDKYLAVYTTHNDDCYSYYNVYQGGTWGAQGRFDWGTQGCPFSTPSGNRTVSYSNVWHMGDQIYDFVRSVATSPNLIVTTDGSSFTYAGRLTATQAVGYVAGYYKYWGNNTDRIDFVGTEAHPRDFDNSLYHGYVRDEKVYDSTGTEIDGNLLDANAQDITSYTTVFATGGRLGSATLTHLWNCDLMRYPDGTIALIFTGRADGNTDDPDKRFGYARFDGTRWTSTYLVKAGHKLYDSEQDYTGLGALHPNNPNTIYISTTTDPRDDTTTFSKHEIWRGTTCDEGKTFEWTPITQNSTQDNLRPVVPYWDSDRTVLLWMRGTYHSAQTYDTDIVGVILDGV